MSPIETVTDKYLAESLTPVRVKLNLYMVHNAIYIDDVLLKWTLETYVVLLTAVAPIYFN